MEDLGKASKELAMALGKDTMASNTGFAMRYTVSARKVVLRELNQGNNQQDTVKKFEIPEQKK